VPKNLATKVPEQVSDEQAAFTVVGAIGLQGIRLSEPTFGETFVVIGLGLIGLLTAELLIAHGCKVIGLDLDAHKLELASQKGVLALNSAHLDPVARVFEATEGVGADGVIITASSKTNAIISQAAGMSRKRGRIVLVGVVGLDIQRSDFYDKELSFQVSCSYGPGRYDPHYEDQGQDYPLAYVRWTEKRNFQAVLQALATGGLNVDPLISKTVQLQNFKEIYSDLGNPQTIACLLDYPEQPAIKHTVKLAQSREIQEGKEIAVIGTGNFTQAVILPELSKHEAPIKTLVSSRGLSSTHLAKKYAISESSTDFESVLNNNAIGMLVITTRHDLHASMTERALRAGKDVFVEKPLSLSTEELQQIIDAVEESGRSVVVGFNRRFAPHARKIRELLGENPGVMTVNATMNAGFIPADEWVHDLKVGGGRIIGEACHLIDLITYFTGSRVERVCMEAMGKNPREDSDVASIFLKYANGSLGVINYFANGSKSYSKERVEVFSSGRNLILDNFRLLSGYGFAGFKKMKIAQDKGHNEQFRLLVERVKNGGQPLIAFDEIVNTSKATFAAIDSLKQGQWVQV
jgi:predicted dehydrogenase